LMLCLDSILLMRLKVDPTKGKKAIDIGRRQICLSLESAMEEFHSDTGWCG
jgi:hypothetical protein